jgi:hypothetical protein
MILLRVSFFPIEGVLGGQCCRSSEDSELVVGDSATMAGHHLAMVCASNPVLRTKCIQNFTQRKHIFSTHWSGVDGARLLPKQQRLLKVIVRLTDKS